MNRTASGRALSSPIIWLPPKRGYNQGFNLKGVEQAIVTRKARGLKLRYSTSFNLKGVEQAITALKIIDHIDIITYGI